MEYTQHKQKLIISICLLNAEKDRIKDIIKAYNNRLDNIYNSIISIMDQVQEISDLENVKDEKQQLYNLIIYSKIFNNNDNELKLLKSEVETNINKIEHKNNILETKIININSNEYNKIKNICNNTFNEDIKLNEIEQNKLIYESDSKTEESETEEDLTGEQEIEDKPNNNNNNNNNNNIDNENNNNNKNNIEIDEQTRKRLLYNAK